MRSSSAILSISITLTIVLSLFASFVAAISEADSYMHYSDHDRVHGIEGTVFLFHDMSADTLSLIDVKSATVLDSVSCKEFNTKSGIRFVDERSTVMCNDGLHRIQNNSVFMTLDNSQRKIIDDPWNNHTLTDLTTTALCVRDNEPKTISLDKGHVTHSTTITHGGNGFAYVDFAISHEGDPNNITILYQYTTVNTGCGPGNTDAYVTTFDISATPTLDLSTNIPEGTRFGNCHLVSIHDISDGVVLLEVNSHCSMSSMKFSINASSPPSGEYTTSADTLYDIHSDCIVTSYPGGTGDGPAAVSSGGKTYQFYEGTIASVACTSDENMTALFEDGEWLTIWRDEDGDRTQDIRDAFPFDDTQSIDSDGDGYGDGALGTTPDACPSVSGNSTLDQYGCKDRDGDGWSDGGDEFPRDPDSWSDDDSDGYPDQGALNDMVDDCPDVSGFSDQDLFGCPDNDGDGYSDLNDVFDNISSQWEDTDSDGFGDNILGFQGDMCPASSGNSTVDRYGCLDSDGDGYSDAGDALPLDPEHWKDADGDGVGDDDDAYPLDATQSKDSDSDTYGDEVFGNKGDACPDVAGASIIDRFGCPDSDGDGVSDHGDAFPDDPNLWQDTDGDGVDDASDPMPFDPTQWFDADGDKMGDNPIGTNADAFPADPSQWTDIDGDGYGDNLTGNNPDAFRTDSTQWADADGDGYGDNPAGRMADAFPNNPTQWEDLDGDGLGDNLNGTDADPYLDDLDNDGYNDSVDILPRLASPGDLDADGCLDEEDAFPSDPSECRDADEDGIGDNADADDDNDGSLDTEEAIAGTNQFSSSSKPIESFEIILPGTNIGLGAWDLIGIFGGIPFFSYLALMLSTRGPRVRRFEEELYEARTEAELSDISRRYERAMLFRLIGPHNGLRLERIRSKLENRFESTSQGVSGGDMWTAGLDSSPVDSSHGSGPTTDMMGQVSSDGYEWLSHGGAQYHRAPHSGQEWTRWG